MKDLFVLMDNSHILNRAVVTQVCTWSKLIELCAIAKENKRKSVIPTLFDLLILES